MRKQLIKCFTIFSFVTIIRFEVTGAQEVDATKVSAQLRELVRGRGGITEARRSVSDMCTVNRDTCSALNLLLAKEFEALGTREGTEAAIDLLESLLERIDKNLEAFGVALSDLGGLYRNQANYEKAESRYVKALEVQRLTLGEKDAEIGISLDNLAGLYEEQGEYGKAEPLYIKALEILRTALGANHSDTGICLNNLAGLYKAKGSYNKAKPLYEEALKISISVFGAKHPETSSSLNNLASLYQLLGRYFDAEPLYIEALEIRRTTLGLNHPATGTSLNNLASLYALQGKNDKAELLFLEAIKIRKAALGDKHPEVSKALNNLAVLYKKQGKLTQAESLYLESLAICRESLSAKHPSTGISLNNLALLYFVQGKYDKSELMYLEALDIYKTALGSKHPDTGTTVSNLAGLYEAQGNFEKAMSRYIEALEIRRTALGPMHPETGISSGNLAALYEAQGKDNQAEDLYLGALEIQSKQFDGQWAAMREGDRRSFLKQFEGIRNINFSHGFLRGAGNGKSALAVRTAFFYKGIRLHAARETQAYLESELGSEAQYRLVKIEDRERKIVLVRSRLSRRPSEEREAATAEAEKLIRSMESEVSALRVEYLQDAAARKMQGRVEVAGLQANLRPGEAFLEVNSYQEFLPKAKGTEKKFGDYRYGAIVFRKSGLQVLVSLGDAGKINELLSDLRDMSRVEGKDSIWDRSNGKLALRKAMEIADHRLRYQAKLKALWRLVLGPVEAKLGAAAFAAVKSWVICPDGPLHGLAWETLMDGQGRYLRERAQVRYVESPRTFVYRNEETATGKPLYVHSPDYGSTQESAKKEGPGLWSAGLAQLQRGLELGTAMRRVHADVEILTGAAASEERLRKLENRKEVVIYTHGEFLQGPMGTDEDLGRVRIALAGAAKGMGKPEELDGTLTASDVAAWRLRGAELVALVGCETGVGSGDVGEGLQGMRRALYLAGSKWQLLSLWTVVDAAAEIWMEHFYEKRKLNPRLGIPEVVDLVQKDFLSGKVKPKRADGTDLGMDHPLLWAGMTLNGQ